MMRSSPGRSGGGASGFSRAISESVYVGDLLEDVREEELRHAFDKFGRIASIEIKRKTRYSFAFVEFTDERAAERSVRDPVYVGGSKVSVNFSRGKGAISRESAPKPSRSSRVAATEYCAEVSNIKPTASWQDLKDHCRSAGEVSYAVKTSPSVGIVYFYSARDLNAAISTLDGTKFRTHENESSTCSIRRITPPRVTPTGRQHEHKRQSRSFSRDRSLSPRGGRYRSRSPPRRRGYRSRSPSRDRSLSRGSSRGYRRNSRSYSPERRR